MSLDTVRVSDLASCFGPAYFAKSRVEARAVTGSFVLWERTVAIRTLKGSPSVESLISCRAVGSSLLAFSIAWLASCIISCSIFRDLHSTVLRTYFVIRRQGCTFH